MTALSRLLIVVLAATALAVAIRVSHAQHAGHPEDLAMHERFYSTWMRPDKPALSCCSRQDCYATQARFKDGNWFAQRREDSKWLKVPPAKIEHSRDSPDGRNHLCAPPPDKEYWSEGGVFCFIVGVGV